MKEQEFKLTPEQYDSLPDFSKYIANFGMNETHKKQCWNDMVKRFSHVEAHNLKEILQEDEQLLMLQLEGLGYTVRNKRGKLSMNVAMPSSTYRSAKSVLYKAKVAGVAITDEDGNPRGKTAVERDTRAEYTVHLEDDVDKFMSMEELVEKAVSGIEKLGGSVPYVLFERRAEFYGKVKDALDKLIDDEIPF